MTKDVLVSISGAHTMDGKSDDVSVITAGSYYYKNGRHYVIYDEVLEGIEGTVRNTVKIGKDCVDIIKGGIARSHMVFEEKKNSVSCYVTPYGQMMVGVTTDHIETEEEEDRLRARIDYRLEINYESVSQCHIEIDVSSKGAAKLKLGS